LLQLASLAFYWIVFSRTNSIGDRAPPEILFLFGLTAMVLAVSELCFNGIWQLPFLIVSGEFDRLLVYPVRGLQFLLVSRPELHALGNLASGAMMLGTSWYLEPPSLTAYLLLPLWVSCGTVIYTSALVVLGSLSFVLLGTWSTHFFIAFHLLNAGRYPVRIYPAWLKFTLLWVVPLGVAISIPGDWLAGQAGFATVLLAPVLAAVTSACLAGLAWTHSSRRYQSTGS
jgi:ABC-2 type transport system permease protein